MVTGQRVAETESTPEVLVWDALAGVHDPEIPPITVIELGMVERVSVSEASVEVDLLPTFAGCPALDLIRDDAETALRAVAGGRRVDVRFVFTPPWSSDRITPAGREALRSHGIAPPGEGRQRTVLVRLGSLAGRKVSGLAVCPFCGSRDTVEESVFGPTRCRATHFCRACRNPFEAFKSKGAR